MIGKVQKKENYMHQKLVLQAPEQLPLQQQQQRRLTSYTWFTVYLSYFVFVFALVTIGAIDTTARVLI